MMLICHLLSPLDADLNYLPKGVLLERLLELENVDSLLPHLVRFHQRDTGANKQEFADMLAMLCVAGFMVDPGHTLLFSLADLRDQDWPEDLRVAEASNHESFIQGKQYLAKAFAKRESGADGQLTDELLRDFNAAVGNPLGKKRIALAQHIIDRFSQDELLLVTSELKDLQHADTVLLLLSCVIAPE